ncbi:Adenylylsulfate kinase [hydrothermal vent metagenome]|uniref:adenylyl-sulfate kinase n=1 Tax=hydrothermal vent metagenome TaxID=652676 RepID=A0A3B1BEV0_9ZZZZ
MAEKSTNVVWHHATVTRELREKQNKHRGAVLWFTGLSGSGKSTLAHAVEDKLHKNGIRTFVLDGDNVRHGLCSDLGFSDDDRTENIRRIGELAKLFLEAGVVVLTAFISPFRQDRELARSVTPHGDFYEVFCDSSLEVCESRDIKGLYAKARAGVIPQFTGISSPYEEPETPEMRINTGEDELDDCAEQVVRLLVDRGVIS